MFWIMENKQQIIDCFLCLCSNPNDSKAVLLLSQMEQKPGFYRTIISFFCDSSFAYRNDHIACFMAIYFKNKINALWKFSRCPPAPSSGGCIVVLTDADKLEIRYGLLAGIVESRAVEKVSSQVALCIAKIARIDFPTSWPDLFQCLFAQAQSASDELPCTMRVLYSVIKQLAAKRLPSDQRKFKELTTELLPAFVQMELNLMSSITESDLSGYQNTTLLVNMRALFFTTKSIRYLCRYGFSRTTDTSTELTEWFLHFLSDIETLAACSSRLSKDGPNTDFLLFYQKITYTIMKMCLEFQESYPKLCVGFLEKLFTISYSITCGTVPYTSVQSSICAMNLLKSILLTSDYTRDGQTMMTITQCCELLNCLVTRYFHLNDHDREKWIMDSEAYANEELTMAWHVDPRAAASALFSTVLYQERDNVDQLFQSWLKLAFEPLSDSAQLPARDALYYALGIAAQFDITHCDSVTYDKLVRVVLIPQFNQSIQLNNSVLQRRILWLCQKLVSHNHVTPPNALSVLQCSINALNKSICSDVIVRLQAANTISEIVEQFEDTVEGDEFVNLIQEALKQLLLLLGDTNEPESHVRILDCTRALIERADDNAIVQLLPMFHLLGQSWDIDYDMLKCSILEFLIHLLKMSHEVLLHHFIEQLLKMVIFSVDVISNPSHTLTLLPTGLDLWLVIAERCSIDQFERLLLPMGNLILPLLLEQTDNELTKTCNIVKVYSSTKLKQCGEILKKIANVVDERMPMLPNDSLSIIIQTCNFVLRCDFIEIVNENIVIKCIGHLLFSSQKSMSVVLTSICFISRLVIFDVGQVCQLLERCIVSHSCDDISGDVSVTAFINMWLQKSAALRSDLVKHKLSCMALCRIMTVDNREIRNILPKIIENIGQSASILISNDKTDVVSQKHQVEASDLEPGIPYEERIYNISKNDLIVSTPLSNWISRCLHETRINFSIDDWSLMWSSVVPEIQSSLVSLLE